MAEMLITHSFVKKLASNIRVRYGNDVRHTQVIELIAEALGRKAGPMMHALKRDRVHTPSSETAIPGTVAIPRLHPKTMVTAEEWISANGISRITEAEKLFAEQLGRPWNGFSGATKAAKLVLINLGLACLEANDPQRPRDSKEMRWWIGVDTTELHKAGMEVLIEKHEQDQELMKIIEDVGRIHAYENTVIHGLMYHLHMHGDTIAPWRLEFVQYLDSDMWHGILNFQQEKNWVQGAGIVCHFLAERRACQPLPKPVVWLEASLLGLSPEGQPITPYSEETL
jgi:hypothetical protein